jgi:hypothetical protein
VTTATRTTKTTQGAPVLNTTEKIVSYANSVADTLVKQGDEFDVVAVTLRARIQRRMERAGLGAGGRFSFLFGTDASRAAKEVTRHAKYAGECQDNAARAMRTLARKYQQLVVEPVKAAESQASDDLQV